MTLDTFNQHMQRLYSLFGDKAYPPERIKRIWHYVERLPDHAMQKIIDQFVETQRNAPLPQEFRTAADAWTKAHGTQRAYSLYNACEHCDGDGYLSEVKELNGRAYSFARRCSVNCQAARHNVAPNYDNEGA